MNIVSNPIEDHQVELIVEVDAETFEGAKHRAAKKIAGKVKIPGFRPGKAPYAVVKNMYGEAAITEEAVEIVVDDIYPKAIDEAGITPGAMGRLDNIESMDPPKFKFIIPLKPTIDLKDYRSVRKAYDFVAPNDSAFEEERANIQKMYARTETVERPVENGDYLLVDIIGRDDAAEEGAEALVDRKGYAHLAKDPSFEGEFPFQGFGKKLFGAKVGDTLTLSNKFKKDHSDEKLAGKKVTFDVTIKVIRAMITPEINDEFAQMTGLGQTVEEFDTNLKRNVEAESKAKYDDEYFEEAIKLIQDGAEIKYPPQIVEHEIEHVIEDLEGRLKNQGIDNLEAYFNMTNTTRDAFIEEHAKPTAVKRVVRGMIMDAIAEAEGVKLENAELEEEFKNYWLTLVYSDPEFAKMTKNGTKFDQKLVNAVSMESANRLLTRKTLDRIKAIANNESEAPSGEPVAETAEAPKAKKPRAKKAKAADPSEAAE